MHLESLEKRTLLHADFAAAVNFSPADAPRAPGMLIDYGSAFDYRRGGYQYGWSPDLSANTVDRNFTRVQRNDTFINMPTGSQWEITVPNGQYRVYVVAGDQTTPGERIALSVEGQLAIAGMTKGRKPFLEADVTVEVTDGRLTIASAGEFDADKINYVGIRTTHSPTIGVTASQPSTVEGTPEAGVLRLERDGDLTDTLTVPLAISGTATNGIDYGTIGSAVTFAPGVAQISLPVRAVADGIVEGDETVILTLGNVPGYQFSQQTATVTITDPPAPDPDPEPEPQNPIPTNLTWSSRAPGTARGEAMAATVNGRLYTFGGYQDDFYIPVKRVDSYNPATNTWTRHADMPVALTHSGMASDDRYVYLGGGYPGTGSGQTFSTTKVRRYDTVTDTWTEIQDLPAARGGGALALVNNTLYHFGGSDSSRNDVATVWSLDLSPPGAQWVTKTQMPSAVNHFNAVTIDGVVYLVAGQKDQDFDAIYQRTLYRYNPANDSWTQLANLINEARSHSASATIVHKGRIWVLGGETYAAGGQGTSRPMANVEVYDPGTNTWTAVTSLPATRKSGVAASIGDQVIFSIGYFNTTFYTNTWIANAP